MGYKSLIAKQVQSSFKILGSGPDGLAQKHTFVNVNAAGSIYDPATRTVAESSVEIPGIPMLLARFKIEDMAPEVKPKTDRKALIATLDLNGIIPAEEDRIKLDDGSIHTVLRLMSDPADALTILHVRLLTP